MYRDRKLWKRVRKRVLQNGESIRHVAKKERISRYTVRKILQREQPPVLNATPKAATTAESPSSVPRKKDCSRQKWMEWLSAVEKREVFSYDLPTDLLTEILPSPQSRHTKALTVLAHRIGFSQRKIAEFLSINKNTVRKYLSAYESGGAEALFGRETRPLLSDDENIKKAVFKLLHEPPSAHGINRSNWRLYDLQSTLGSQGHEVGEKTIRTIIKKAGYRWRSAKVVLTSTDPEYREKLEKIHSILSVLKEDERFFSIDEFGSFSIKAKAGKVLVPPDVQPSVPQWQKSKGWLILTAALELSTNQVSHFYSTAKNTDEMIRMANLLIDQYRNCNKLVLSWDAASWHISKKLTKFIEKHNATAEAEKKPLVELAPLPASAQFLNVIESVFSGMARAIIHSSDYPSVDTAKDAIDQYFAERNMHYKENPKRAGKKIWGKERVSCEFDASNNCKDPAFR